MLSALLCALAAASGAGPYATPQTTATFSGALVHRCLDCLVSSKHAIACSVIARRALVSLRELFICVASLSLVWGSHVPGAVASISFRAVRGQSLEC